MLNNIYLVGRLVSDPELKETENNKKVSKITLAVPRSYKNEDGIYETDFIPARLFNGIATQTLEYCKKGDLIGIKGRLQMSDTLEVIAEKVTFLSTNKDLINRED